MVAATPWPQPISRTRSSGRIASWSTTRRRRSLTPGPRLQVHAAAAALVLLLGALGGLLSSLLGGRLHRLLGHDARRERATHLLQLGPRGHLLGVDRGLDAVEQPLEPTDELCLRTLARWQPMASACAVMASNGSTTSTSSRGAGLGLRARRTVCAATPVFSAISVTTSPGTIQASKSSRWE